ncbi:TetR/AcrR family transcriptional regulator [Dietzia maris]|jgi:AcrR family transcriptional regulator|uniref:TetR/AcrR family transcriptional regulator n=1 Tax=unclassified Dietzia TaxID=2617939 RepID=UPI0008059C6F|nr:MULTISPECIES: TetR/AcrR family transcriptional regulator [unclassified Dietzia]MBC7308123.1 TetR/AcrR family transcriptional regulator [Dietzia sp.]MDV3356084.1 TetR/AcrR family transcriptional regulator [Dietzia sp. IN118]OAV76558.1 TetR family transcriptional regulator [Dietzia sp. 111N12-1]
MTTDSSERAQEPPQDPTDEAVQDEPNILVPRRRPIQERSRRKFQALLSSAREVLVEVGFDSFTCEEVASRAGVPIGTLYQFFANKYVLVCELDRQDAHGVIEEVERFAQKIPALDWPELLNDFLDHLADLWLRDPSRRAVWLATQATPATRATAAVNEREIARMIASVLAPLMPATERERRAFMAEALVHVAYSMLNFSVSAGHVPPGPVTSADPGDGSGVSSGASSGSAGGEDIHDATVTELKRMLTAYLWLAEKEAAQSD